MLDFSRFNHLTFDCYGTLIDWETGILNAMKPVLQAKGGQLDDTELLQLYSRFEADIEAGPYLSYREVLRRVAALIADAAGCEADESGLNALPNSVGGWPPFSDTVDALKRLGGRYRLSILSNVDDDMFTGTAHTLGVDFHAVITAQQLGSYKPSHNNFLRTLERLEARPDEVLHVAQSIYHDHAPAKELGFTTVWVNRESRRPGSGAAPNVEDGSHRPDLEVPDLETLARVVGV